MLRGDFLHALREAKKATSGLEDAFHSVLTSPGTGSAQAKALGAVIEFQKSSVNLSSETLILLEAFGLTSAISADKLPSILSGEVKTHGSAAREGLLKIIRTVRFLNRNTSQIIDLLSTQGERLRLLPDLQVLPLRIISNEPLPLRGMAEIIEAIDKFVTLIKEILQKRGAVFTEEPKIVSADSGSDFLIYLMEHPDLIVVLHGVFISTWTMLRRGRIYNLDVVKSEIDARTGLQELMETKEITEIEADKYRERIVTGVFSLLRLKVVVSGIINNDNSSDERKAVLDVSARLSKPIEGVHLLLSDTSQTKGGSQTKGEE
jgi:hypothetical protein